ncbi:hypothetical protein G6M87_17165 [Rhizobium rhizogenes]|uniref:hypothetical protein n=1 Tax=Rhizobium rhizogenes TaxID=359 RepID=UPI001574372F|nr:hypothetical protein [Rhizobium rhizogenes]NTI23602.1 hypothetical protein [Rhizobium rhizogenes]QTG07115.1 hypothetical protein G6M87_17165 [Rhizobium rhizogenes]
MSISEEERDRVRQSERTIDNLKRLYAVLFSLSFGIVAIESFKKIGAFADSTAYALGPLILHMEITISFIFTAGLFYYQGDRFLDTVYAKQPLAPTKPAHFGADYFVNVFTMVPFYLMAQALGKEYTDAVGFTWYFLAYVYLIGQGLALLLIREIIGLKTKPVVPEDISALKAFWFVMNSLMLFISVFAYFVWTYLTSSPCPTNYHAVGVSFVAVMGILILLRDYLDFTRGWAILYPVQDANVLKWPLPSLRRESARTGAWIAGLILIALTVGLVVVTGLWDLPTMAATCKVKS